MKRLISITIFVLLAFPLLGQSQEQKDSLIYEMCQTLMTLDKLNDSTRLQQTYTQHLFPFLGQFPEENRQQLGYSIYIRFQHHCRAFKDLLDRNYPIHEDWQNLSERPISEMKTKECKNFSQYNNFWYYENSGDTVKVLIKDGIWVDNFKDGTFSRLKFRRSKKCRFELEFIESNNVVRKNFSIPGDIYKYQLLDKKDGYYDVVVELVDMDAFMKFKMYIEE